jgi:hypothetical protein
MRFVSTLGKLSKMTLSFLYAFVFTFAMLFEITSIFLPFASMLHAEV